jgi:outer membrane lipoprotein-sorting protein
LQVEKEHSRDTIAEPPARVKCPAAGHTCSLLTKAEAARFLGTPVTLVTPESSQANDGCRYSNASKSENVYITVDRSSNALQQMQPLEMSHMPAAALAVTGFAPVAAQANPTSDLAQVWRTFATVKSFHAAMKMPGNRNVSLDMIVPNKMHVTMPEGMQMIRINSDAWIYRQGSWTKLPVAMPQMGAMTEGARNMGLNGKPDADDYTVSYLGPAVVNGTPAQHYRVARKDNSTKPIEMWVGPNHLPLQVVSQTDSGPMTILYSNYNRVADITPPM